VPTLLWCTALEQKGSAEETKDQSDSSPVRKLVVLMSLAREPEPARGLLSVFVQSVRFELDEAGALVSSSTRTRWRK